MNAFELVTDGGVLAGTLMPVLDYLSNAVRVTVIHVSVERKARRHESFFDSFAQGIMSPARGGVYGTRKAVLLGIAGVVVPVLRLYEIWQQTTVRPPGVSNLFTPPVEVGGVAASPYTVIYGTAAGY